MDIELIAPCGIDCINCVVLESNITEETRTRVAASTGKKPEEVSCKGCRPLEGKNLPIIADCETYRCVTAKGLDFCSDCEDFPCSKLAPCAFRAEVFPHNMKVFNLCKIKSMGLDAWLKEVQSIRAHYYQGKLVPGSGPKIVEK